MPRFAKLLIVPFLIISFGLSFVEAKKKAPTPTQETNQQTAIENEDTRESKNFAGYEKILIDLKQNLEYAEGIREIIDHPTALPAVTISKRVIEAQKEFAKIVPVVTYETSGKSETVTMPVQLRDSFIGSRVQTAHQFVQAKKTSNDALKKIFREIYSKFYASEVTIPEGAKPTFSGNIVTVLTVLTANPQQHLENEITRLKGLQAELNSRVKILNNQTNANDDVSIDSAAFDEQKQLIAFKEGKGFPGDLKLELDICKTRGEEYCHNGLLENFGSGFDRFFTEKIAALEALKGKDFAKPEVFTSKHKVGKAFFTQVVNFQAATEKAIFVVTSEIKKQQIAQKIKDGLDRAVLIEMQTYGVDVDDYFTPSGVKAVHPRVIFYKVVQLLAHIAGTIAVGCLVVGGVMLKISSGLNEQGVDQAKGVIIKSLVGIVVVFLAEVGVAWLIRSVGLVA